MSKNNGNGKRGRPRKPIGCVHYWLIEDGIGTCKYCHEVKDFDYLQGEIRRSRVAVSKRGGRKSGQVRLQNALVFGKGAGCL